MSDNPPKGSGYFAAIVGVIFLCAFIGSFFGALDQLSRQWLMRAWLVFVAAILILWGVNRIKKGRPDATVGQDTINLVNGVISSTIALLALLLGK